MNIRFKKIILHNFMSFGHSEVELDNKGHCLVSGINNYPMDNTNSNGSGKSTIWSAISYALTGKTIQGLSSGLKNINIEEDNCYVTLLFNVGKDEYEITRIHRPKTDLSILVNGVDKSGKGVRESSVILEQLLPDLTSDLIGSVIILGQGLPHKFSLRSPSERKQLLEKLSNSDFMIQDIKSRLIRRAAELNDSNKEIEENIIALEANKTLLLNQLTNNNQELLELKNINEYNSKIDEIDLEIEELENEKQSLEADIEEITLQQEINDKTILSLIETSNSSKQTILEAYTQALNIENTNKVTLESQLQNLNSEIIRLQSIKDTCPTCGQKIPNVVKPDLTKQFEEKKLLGEKLQLSLTNMNSFTSDKNKKIKEIEENYSDSLKELNNLKISYKLDLETKLNTFSKLRENIIDLEKVKANLINKRDNIIELKTKLEDSILEIETTLIQIEENKENNIKEKNKLLKHIEIINKMDTLIKRDFRGYLLTNLISYIDRKGKEYCQDVFGSKEFNFELDGNNLAISYCGKDFDLLSGGERQKIDLIIQFAIRDMMVNYLNFSSNILVLDEIFDNLDTTGTAAVLDLIQFKLSNIDSVFIISHHANELNIPYDNEMTLVKDEKGISSIC